MSEAYHSHEQQRREEIHQFEEASGPAGLPTDTGDRVTATSGETVQVKPWALLHLLSFITHLLLMWCSDFRHIFPSVTVTWFTQLRACAMPSCQQGRLRRRVGTSMLSWSRTGQRMPGLSGRTTSCTRSSSSWRRRRIVSPGVKKTKNVLPSPSSNQHGAC